MRENPLATAIRGVLAPEFAAFADPLHPGRIFNFAIVSNLSSRHSWGRSRDERPLSLSSHQTQERHHRNAAGPVRSGTLRGVKRVK